MLEGIYWAQEKQDPDSEWELAELSTFNKVTRLAFFGYSRTFNPDLYDLVPIELTDPWDRPYPYKEATP